MISESFGDPNPAAPLGVEGRCPHFVVERFLGDAVVQQLLTHVDRRRAEFMPATVYRQQGQADIADVESRNCLRLAQIGPFESGIRTEIQRVLPTALMKLGLLDRQVIAREFEFCAYGHGGHFRAHHDILPHGRPRIVSCVYYFFREPAGFTGGELRLYGWPSPKASGAQDLPWIDIPARCDKLVIFPSGLKHEVRPVVLPSGDWGHHRFTINCWAYRPKGAGGTG
jgi:SM-20-related protein